MANGLSELDVLEYINLCDTITCGSDGRLVRTMFSDLAGIARKVYLDKSIKNAALSLISYLLKNSMVSEKQFFKLGDFTSFSGNYSGIDFFEGEVHRDSFDSRQFLLAFKQYERDLAFLVSKDHPENSPEENWYKMQDDLVAMIKTHGSCDVS